VVEVAVPASVDFMPADIEVIGGAGAPAGLTLTRLVFVRSGGMGGDVGTLRTSIGGLGDALSAGMNSGMFDSGSAGPSATPDMAAGGQAWLNVNNRAAWNGTLLALFDLA
jgi:hypothetical protein